MTTTSWLPPGIDLSDAKPGSIEELLSRLVGISAEEAERDPHVRAHIARTLARHSPAGLAIVAGRGRWQLARHHALMNQAIVEACNTPEGRLILSVSVRAGKSLLGARYTSAWHIGTRPDENVMLGAHEAGFSAEHAGFARDIIAEYGPALYGVSLDRTSSARNRWQIDGHAGGMISVGVGGSPIGRGGHLMVIDDPFKSYEAAMSDRQRQRVNETWFQGTMSSRMEPGGTIIVICSRWHEDDLSGWLLTNFPGEWREVHIPAIADRPDDIMGRPLGASFWPERWPAALLRRREREVGPVIWLSQYQQRPTAPTGGMFPIGKIRAIYREPTTNVDSNGVCLDPVLDMSRVVQLCRAWDLAATEGDGDWTVGLLLGRYDDGRWVIIDIVRGQWGEAQVRQVMQATAHADALRYGHGTVLVELPQDPGQAGKAQAAQMGAMLSGAPVEARIQSGSKATRAAGVAAQWQMGNVDLVIADPELEPERSAANRALLDEARVFDKGQHDDTIDALAGAFNRMASTVIVDDPVGGGTAAFAAVGQRRSNELR